MNYTYLINLTTLDIEKIENVNSYNSVKILSNENTIKESVLNTSMVEIVDDVRVKLKKENYKLTTQEKRVLMVLALENTFLKHRQNLTIHLKQTDIINPKHTIYGFTRFYFYIYLAVRDNEIKIVRTTFNHELCDDFSESLTRAKKTFEELEFVDKLIKESNTWYENYLNMYKEHEEITGVV